MRTFSYRIQNVLNKSLNVTLQSRLTHRLKAYRPPFCTISNQELRRTAGMEIHIYCTPYLRICAMTGLARASSVFLREGWSVEISGNRTFRFAGVCLACRLWRRLHKAELHAKEASSVCFGGSSENSKASLSSSEVILMFGSPCVNGSAEANFNKFVLSAYEYGYMTHAPHGN